LVRVVSVVFLTFAPFAVVVVASFVFALVVAAARAVLT